MTRRCTGVVRQALTLFEIAISTLILSVAILASLALLPSGIEAEIYARSRLLASAAAISMLESFHNPPTTFPDVADVQWIHHGTGPSRRASDRSVGRGTVTVQRSYNQTQSVTNLRSLVETGSVLPNFATGFYNAAYLSGAHAHDLEKVLLSRDRGLIPIPPTIARRLYDDKGEIQALLDGGGAIYYLDAEMTRDLTASPRNSLGGHTAVDEAAHRLVVGVLGAAQQNLLPYHPWDRAPVYEMYPFAPPSGASGAIKGRDYWTIVRNGSVSGTASLKDMNNDSGDDDIWYKADGYLGYEVTASSPNDYTHHPANPLDFPGIDAANAANYTPAGAKTWRDEIENWDTDHNYQYKNWRGFAAREWTASGQIGVAGLSSSVGGQVNGHRYKWLAGWPAFYQLCNNPHAGAAVYLAQLTAESAFDFSPYGGIHPLVHAAVAAGYAATTSGVKSYYQSQSMESPNSSCKWNNTGVKAGLQANLNDMTSIPQIKIYNSSYEMRASYRDYALRLWDAVRPFALNGSSPTGSLTTLYDALGIDTSDRSNSAVDLLEAARVGSQKATVIAALRPTVAFAEHYRSNLHCGVYGIPALALEEFQALDPYQLLKVAQTDGSAHDALASNCPPHPAQVLALSYLAHAAMAVTGMTPPFSRRIYPVDASRDRDGEVWNSSQSTPIFGSDMTSDFKDWKAENPTYLLRQNVEPKDVKYITHIAPDRSWLLLRQSNALVAADIVDFVDNEVDPLLYDDPCWIDPQVRGAAAEPGSAEHAFLTDFGQRSLLFHPGDCIYIHTESDVISDYVYEIGSDASSGLSALEPVFITAEQNSPTVVQAMLDSEAGAATSTNLVRVYVRRVWQVDYHKGLIERPDLFGTLQGVVTVADPTQPLHAYRVATPQDLAFARKVHEMSLRWAAAYTAENPYDWGAPRMANRQTMMDKPLALFDLFLSSGAVVPTPAASIFLDRNGNEPVYRWLMPPNPDADRYASQLNNKIHRLSNHAPMDTPPGAHTAIVDRYYAFVHDNNGSMSTASGDNDNDSSRFWPLRPFHPRERCRELVFWSAPWKHYEDAESALSAPVDFTRQSLVISQYLQERHGHKFGALIEPWVSDERRRHPELGLMFSPQRDVRTSPPTKEDLDKTETWVINGAYGADRNMNGSFDVGDIPAGTRMHAREVARFNFYDPVLLIHSEN